MLTVDFQNSFELAQLPVSFEYEPHHYIELALKSRAIFGLNVGIKQITFESSTEVVGRFTTASGMTVDSIESASDTSLTGPDVQAFCWDDSTVGIRLEWVAKHSDEKLWVDFTLVVRGQEAVELLDACYNEWVERAGYPPLGADELLAELVSGKLQPQGRDIAGDLECLEEFIGYYSDVLSDDED